MWPNEPLTLPAAGFSPAKSRARHERPRLGGHPLGSAKKHTVESQSKAALPVPGMGYRLLADFTVLLHLVFVVFVIGGGFLVARWPRVAWVHLTAVAWGAWVEFAGWICPLTPLENWLRAQGGGPAYASSFIEQYVMPLLYPASLSREAQYALGTVVLLLNAVIYAALLRRQARR